MKKTLRNQGFFHASLHFHLFISYFFVNFNRILIKGLKPAQALHL